MNTFNRFSGIIVILVLVPLLANPVLADEPEAPPATQPAEERRAVDPVVRHSRDQLAEAELTIEELQRQESRLSDRLRRLLHGRADLSPEAIRATARRLDEQREALEIDVFGLKARRDALLQVIEEERARLEGEAEDDPVAAELEKVVAVHEDRVASVRRRHEQRAVADIELRNAEGELALARARLAERREAVRLREGGNLLPELNRELTMLTIDLREKEARMRLVMERANRLANAAQAVDELEHVRERLQESHARKTLLERQLQEMERMFR